MYTNFNRYLSLLLKGETATPPIAPFSSRLTSLLLLAGAPRSVARGTREAGSGSGGDALTAFYPRSQASRLGVAPSLRKVLLLPKRSHPAASSRLASQLEKGTLGGAQLPFLGST